MKIKIDRPKGLKGSNLLGDAAHYELVVQDHIVEAFRKGAELHIVVAENERCLTLTVQAKTPEKKLLVDRRPGAVNYYTGDGIDPAMLGKLPKTEAS